MTSFSVVRLFGAMKLVSVATACIFRIGGAPAHDGEGVFNDTSESVISS